MNPWPVTIVMALKALFYWKSRWNYMRLPEVRLADPGLVPDQVTIVIPARNEERKIAKVVGSFKGYRVIVVNDHSTDRTAAYARNAGAEVVHAPALPAGWLGKPHACWTGAKLAATPWILFVDADTWFESGFAAAMVAFAESQGADFASALLRQHTGSFAEHVLLPYAFALYFCGVSAASVNSAKSSEAFANGQCLLARREAYESIGGHQAVAGSVIEDVALASVAKSKGLTVLVARAESAGHVRMYESWGEIWRGFQKNSFRFLLVNPVSGLQVTLASILWTTWLPLLVAMGLGGQPWLAAAVAVLPVIGLAPWYGGFGRALLAPLAIYGFQVIAIHGMLTAIFGWKTDWKGRPV